VTDTKLSFVPGFPDDAGGLAEEVDEKILHAAFVPFGEVKDVKTPLDQATQKHRSFGFVTFLEREDAAAAMDNMDGAELFGRVLTVNYAFPEKIKGGEQGWAAQPSMSRLLCFLICSIAPCFLDCRNTRARTDKRADLMYGRMIRGDEIDETCYWTRMLFI
jgi:RNA recognition motif-containing protein